MASETSSDDRADRRLWFRLIAFLVPAAVFVGLLSYGLASSSGPPGPGDPAPSFEAPLLEGGGTLSLSDFEGQPVVVNFWASWCAPCEDEAPLLEAAYEAYGDRVAFVGVDIKDARSDAIAFIEEFEVGYPNVVDDGRIEDDYGLTGQPETFVIDAEGRISRHIPGALPDLETLTAALDEVSG